MARLWQSGFELNSTTTDVEFSNITGAGTTIQTTTVRTGTYALRCNPSAATGFVRYHVFTSNQSIVAYQRVYMRIATLPGANTTIMRFLDVANSPCAQIRITSTGTLILLDAAGNAVGSASSVLSTGQWYRIELGLDASTNPGTVEAKIDGTSFASGNNSAQAPWGRVLVGPVVSATMDAYFDDWAVNDSSGSAQNSWCGDGHILHLAPNGDGDAHGWNNTSNAAGSSTNWQLVDEVPPNDTTDLVQTGTANTEDMYALTDSGIGAGDTVNVVMVGLRLRNNTADTIAAVKAQIKKGGGGTIAQGSAIVPNSTTFGTNASAQPRNYTLITYLDPDGSAWTQSTLDTAQAGIKLTTAGTNRIQVTSVWVSVDYTASSGTNATVNASAVNATTTLPIPTLSADETAAPSAVAATTSIPAPTVGAGASASPARVDAATALPAPDLATSSTATPSPLAAAATVPAPTVEASSTLEPPAVNATATLPGPAVSIDATTEPAPLAAAATVPVVDLSAGSTASPGAVMAAASMPAPAVTSGAAATQSPLAASVSVPSPSVSADGNITVQASTVTATATVPEPGLSASTEVSAALAATAAVPSPALAAGAAATPGTVQCSAALPQPVMSTGTTAHPPAVSATSAIPATVLAASATVETAPIMLTATVPPPTAVSHAIIQAAALTLNAALPIPTPMASVAVQPSLLAFAAAIPAPSVTAQAEQDITVTAGALVRGWSTETPARSWSVGAPTT